MLYFFIIIIPNYFTIIMYNQLYDMQNKIKELPQTTIDIFKNNNNSSEPQQILLNEIIETCKFANPKNRKYSDSWILLSIIFHIR